MNDKRQRRKGNAQSASSSKAAELLQQGGFSVPFLPNQFIPSGTVDQALFECSTELLPELQIIFKKLSKRDAITREKALKELRTMLENIQVQQVKASFSYFAALYQKLVTDAISAIRSLANSILSLYLQLLKKEVAEARLRATLPFLLISLNDGSAHVCRSANDLLVKCFSEDKAPLLFKRFAHDAIKTSLDLIELKHKLVLPQQFPDDETDSQRRTRLITQALLTIEHLVNADDENSVEVFELLSRPNVQSSLLSMKDSAKTSFLILLKKLATLRSESFLLSKLISALMNEFDALDSALCQSSIDCFLVLASNRTFFEICNMDKALIPRLIYVVRKKSTHWNVLELSLLPLFSLVFRNLCDRNRQSKFAQSILDSFFEGTLHSISLKSWTNAFYQLMEFYITNLGDTEETISYAYSKLKQFVRILFEANAPVDAMQKGVKLVDFACKRLQDCNSIENANFLSALAKTLLEMLPSSEEMLLSLFHFFDQPTLSLVLESDKLSDRVFAKILPKYIQSFPDAKINFHLISRRISNTDESSNIVLLEILCSLMSNEKAPSVSISRFVDLKEFWIATNLTVVLSSRNLVNAILEAQEQFEVTNVILTGLLSCQYTFKESQLEKFTLWILETFNSSGDMDMILNYILASTLFTSSSSLSIAISLFSGIKDEGKIPQHIEMHFAEKFFVELLADRVPEINSALLAFLKKIPIDKQLATLRFQEFYLRTDVNLETLKRIIQLIGGVNFLNFSISELFLLDGNNLASIANAFDEHFSGHVLSHCELFLPFCLRFTSSIQEYDRYSNKKLDNLKLDQTLKADENLQFLLNSCKEALCTALLDDFADDNTLHEQYFARVFLCSSYANFFKRKITSHEDFLKIEPFSRELNKFLQDRLDEKNLARFFEMFAQQACKLSGNVNDYVLPFSVIFSLYQILYYSSYPLSATKLLELINKKYHQTNEYQILHLTLTMKHQRPTEEELLPFVGDTLPAETHQLVTWLSQFEFASLIFNEENRAEHFVTLALFIEQQRETFQDWLFTVQGNDPMKDIISCSILRFCSKIIPFLPETGDGPIRDFINCGFLTAFQDCTDFFLKRTNKATGSFHFVLAYFCLEISTVYETVIGININNPDFVSFRQEWEDFFGPSTTTYVLTWFIQFTSANFYHYPSFLRQMICRAIHSLNSRMLLDAEISDELYFSRRIETEDKKVCSNGSNVLAAEYKCISYFESYPPKLRSLLIPTFFLIFSSSLDVQMAAAFIIKSSLFTMFSIESPSQLEADLKADVYPTDELVIDDPTPSTSGQANIEGPTDEIEEATLPPKESLHKKLPNCLLSLLEFERTGESAIHPSFVAWDILIRFLSELDPLSRIKYSEAIEQKFVFAFLARFFSELPEPEKNLEVQNRSVDELFNELLQPKRQQIFTNDHFMCNLFFRTLITIPAMFRDWYNTLSKAQSNVISKYVKKYISHLAIRREMQGISNFKRGKLEVRVFLAVNEVECVYRLEEAAVQLTILLPDNYPLSPPKILTERSIVSKDLHRKWLFQLEVFISRQNGPLLDGILQWKRNIDHYLKGVEDCTICMMTVSSTNYQLPKIRCRQCRKKFHGDCLYKWFETSQKSTCPLCRANFI